MIRRKRGGKGASGRGGGTNAKDPRETKESEKEVALCLYTWARASMNTRARATNSGESRDCAARKERADIYIHLYSVGI